LERSRPDKTLERREEDAEGGEGACPPVLGAITFSTAA
jgi:hypothetical protein